MKTAWAQKTKRDKILFALRTAASTGAFVCALLRLCGGWEQALNAAMPLLGTALLLQSVQEWRNDRLAAIFGLCVALFIFVCCAVIWFMK